MTIMSRLLQLITFFAIGTMFFAQVFIAVSIHRRDTMLWKRKKTIAIIVVVVCLAGMTRYVVSGNDQNQFQFDPIRFFFTLCFSAYSVWDVVYIRAHQRKRDSQINLRKYNPK